MWNRRRRVVRWCSLSSSSKTVLIVGVGIEFDGIWAQWYPLAGGAAGFDYAENLYGCRKPCKMHFVLIFVIFAFQGVHGYHFYVIFDFIFDFIFVCFSPK